jgi:hypothetical protein
MHVGFQRLKSFHFSILGVDVACYAISIVTVTLSVNSKFSKDMVAEMSCPQIPPSRPMAKLHQLAQISSNAFGCGYHISRGTAHNHALGASDTPLLAAQDSNSLHHSNILLMNPADLKSTSPPGGNPFIDQNVK